MREYTIAVIPGDGIGPEVISAGLQVLRALERGNHGFRLLFKESEIISALRRCLQ